jgi:DNA-binding CsgD family transcriptional regulator/tetratricopeptide (TPR) repeat protein
MSLVERESELDALTALLDGLAAGRSRAALIEGPAGIGKTRLLAAAREAARERGIPSLGARGSELEREFPFGVVRQMIEPALMARPNRGELFEGAAEVASAVFAPPGTESLGDDASFAVLHGLYWLTLDLVGDKPLLLTIDDLHWCDRPSLRMLAYVVRRLEGIPLLIVATMRNTEPGTDPALLAEIAQDPMTERIHPGPLSPAAMPALIERRLGAAPDGIFAAACHDATGGNPLLLEELLKGLAAEGIEPRADRAGVVRDLGPRAVSRAVLLRLARLSDSDVAVARALAVLGEGADLSEIAALAGLDSAAVAKATGELVRVEILRREAPLGFVHPLVRDAVYLELPPGERELQHTRAARVLDGLGASPEQVSAHMLAMPRSADPWVAGTLHDAARAALRRGTADSAVAYLRRAVAEPPPPEQRPAILVELGLAEVFESAADAIAHLLEAHAAMTGIERARVAEAVARIMLLGASAETAATFALAAARELDGSTDPEAVQLRKSLFAVVDNARIFGSTVEPRERLADHRDPSRIDGIGERRLVALAAYEWMHEGGSRDDCATLWLAALETDELIEDDVFVAMAVWPLVIAERDEVDALFEKWIAVAHRRGSAFTRASNDLFAGELALRRGELVEAEEKVGRGYRELERWGHEGPRPWTTGFYANVAIELGRLDDAAAALAGAGTVPSRGDGGVVWLGARMRFDLETGDPEAALARAHEIEARPNPLRNPAYVPWIPLQAIALDRLGRTDEARAVAAHGVEQARRWGALGALGMTLRVQGTVERDVGLLREAVDVLETSRARLEHAKALAALGSALRLERKPTDARDPLLAALELAEICGSPPLVEHLRTEVAAAGLRPRTHALSGSASLTASERRVVELAAAGQTNRDIAQGLFVTPKTVEVHLTNSYRKLGVRSRRELAGALAG